MIKSLNVDISLRDFEKITFSLYLILPVKNIMNLDINILIFSGTTGRIRSASECLPHDRMPSANLPNSLPQSKLVFPGETDKSRDDFKINFEGPPASRQRSYSHSIHIPSQVFDPHIRGQTSGFPLVNSMPHISPLGQPSDNFFKCKICGIMYNTEEKLRFHMELHNERFKMTVDVSSTPTSSSSGKLPTPTKSDPHLASPQEPLMCPECSKVLNSDDEYRRHLLTHIFKCKCCSQTFETEMGFLLHIKTHGDLGDHPYQCFLCDKQFSHVSHLTRHVLSHPEDRQFSCVECGKNFTRKGHMTRHMAMHSGCRPYVCSDCGKDFAHRTHLRRHEIVHSGLRPFQCTVCHQAFSRKSSLSRHYFIHTTEKPFVCPVCQKGFNRKGRLRNHLRIHIREGYPDLVDYKIERRPISKEFIEEMNKVQMPKLEGSASGSSVIVSWDGESGTTIKSEHVSVVKGKSPGGDSERSHDPENMAHDESDDDESSTDSEDGDDHMSEEIGFDEPHHSETLDCKRLHKPTGAEQKQNSPTTALQQAISSSASQTSPSQQRHVISMTPLNSGSFALHHQQQQQQQQHQQHYSHQLQHGFSSQQQQHQSSSSYTKQQTQSEQ